MWLTDLLLSFMVPGLALLGWSVVRALLPDRLLSHGPSGFAMGLALALGWLQVGAMVLGMGGWLTPVGLGSWLGLGLMLSCALGKPWTLTSLLVRPPAWLLWLFVAFVPTLLMALVPPWYRDSMVYHLALPRQYAQAGGFILTDDNIFASFPLGYECILSILHVFGSEPTHDPIFNPRLVGAWTTLGGAFGLIGLTRMLGVGPRVSAGAGILMLLIPTWIEFGGSCYVESYMVLLSTLAMACGMRWVEGEPRAALPMALLLGLVAGVKYPGLAVMVFLLGLTLLFLLFARRSEEQGVGRALVDWMPLLLTAIVLAAPFYLRNILERGNPVFPMFYEVFGGRGWDEVRAQGYAYTLADYGAGRAFLDYLLLPWRLFTTREINADFDGSLGPIPLVIGMLGMWQVIASRRRGPVFLLCLGLIWSAFWALQVQQVRFYLVGLVPFMALGFWGIDQRLSQQAKRMFFGVAGVGAVLWLVTPWWDSNQQKRKGPLVELWQRQQTGAYLTGDVTTDEVLESVMPWTYRPYLELGEYVPEDGKVWLVYARAHTYYLKRDYKLDCVFEDWRFVEELMSAETEEVFVDQLQNDGVTHLLVNHGSFLHPLDSSVPEALRQRFDALREGGWITAETHWMIGRDPDYLQPMVLYRVESES